MSSQYSSLSYDDANETNADYVVGYYFQEFFTGTMAHSRQKLYSK
jgi:hypothetical protein